MVSGKFSSKTDAEKLRTGCLGKTAVVQSVAQKDKSERLPMLYDLATLQQEANRLFDYTPQQILDYLQSLYVKRLATYSRTDSRYFDRKICPNIPYSGTFRLTNGVITFCFLDFDLFFPTQG